MANMHSLQLVLCFIAVFALSACDPTVNIGSVDAGQRQCAPSNRTCADTFGTFQVQWSDSQAACKPSLESFQIIFRAFDGGSGQVTVGGNTVTGVRSGCSTIVDHLIGSGPVELVYNPDCDTVRVVGGSCGCSDGGSVSCEFSGGRL